MKYVIITKINKDIWQGFEKRMIEFHADDYGLFLAQSKRILDCSSMGCLNGTSVFPNGRELDPCLSLLSGQGLMLTIHLNLMQGRCLARPNDVSLLVNESGIFRVRFSQLLFAPFTGKYFSYKKQLKTELSAQINRLLPYFEQNHLPLRLDGHAHWHMIPVVFDALMELIQENDYPVAYIRIPSEPIGLYWRNLPKIVPFPVINIIKMFLLRLLARRNNRKWSTALSNLEHKVFLGVLLSGCFDIRRMSALLSGAVHYAKKHSAGLEILAHPGSVHEPEDISQITNQNDLQFFTSPAREVEADSLMRIGTYTVNY